VIAEFVPLLSVSLFVFSWLLDPDKVILGKNSLLDILTSSFEQVLMYTGVCLILTSSLTVLALFISRFKDLKSKRPYKTWGYPFTPVIYLFLNMWILFYSIKESPFESIIGMAIFTLSVGIYFIINKKYITSR